MIPYTEETVNEINRMIKKRVDSRPLKLFQALHIKNKNNRLPVSDNSTLITQIEFNIIKSLNNADLEFYSHLAQFVFHLKNIWKAEAKAAIKIYRYNNLFQEENIDEIQEENFKFQDYTLGDIFDKSRSLSKIIEKSMTSTPDPKEYIKNLISDEYYDSYKHLKNIINSTNNVDADAFYLHNLTQVESNLEFISAIVHVTYKKTEVILAKIIGVNHPSLALSRTLHRALDI